MREAQLDVMKTLSATLRVWLKHAPALIGLALLIELPMLVMELAPLLFGSSLATQLVAALGQLLNLGASLVLTGLVARLLFCAMSGQPASLGATLKGSVPHLLPLLAVSLVMLVSLMFGALLCVVPGLLLGLVWAVAVPVVAVEHVGPIDALTRSSQLTKGQRLPIFILFFVVALCFGGCLFVFSLPALIFGALGGLFAAIMKLALYTLSAVVSALIAALLVTIYAELRALKEGVRPEQLAREAW